MFFCTTSFFSGTHAMQPTPTAVSGIDRVAIQNAIFDTLYAQSDLDSPPVPEFQKAWDYNVLLYAKFNGNLLAGNIDAMLSQTSAIRIKRRKTGSYDWMTLHEISSENEDITDYIVEFFDRTVRSQTSYDYAIVPVTNDIEGAMSIVSIRSEFDSLCLIDADEAFQTACDVDVSVQRNAPSATVVPLASKYAYVVHNSQSNFSSGNASAFFLPKDFESGEFPVNFEGGHPHRDVLMDFLCNGKSKLLKLRDGRMWLIDVSDNPSESHSEHENKILTSFAWTETGDCESARDLYDSGLIQIRPNAN